MRRVHDKQLVVGTITTGHKSTALHVSLTDDEIQALYVVLNNNHCIYLQLLV